MTDFMASALEYAAHGWRVFPCKALGKRPLTSMGFKEATTSAQIIADWWTQWPDANIGIAVPAGYVVVDVDGEEGRGVLVSQDLDLPSSSWASTPSGGSHHWYKLPPGIECGPRVGLLPSVDTRAFGSYVVVEPSVFEGGFYKWEVELSKKKIAEAPEWLCHMVSHKVMQKERIDPDEVLSGVPEGRRDVTLFRYACQLRRKGNTRKEIELLIAGAASLSTPPFDHDLAMVKVSQALKYAGPEAKQEQVKIWSLQELVDKRFEQPRWIVDGLLPEGLAILVAGPKQGKSLAAARLALEASAGVRFMDTFKTNRTGVLYLDLEDAPVFAQQRWVKINRGMKFPDNCFTSFRWDRMDNGGLGKIEKFLDNNPSVGLVVIDILSNFWPMDTDSGGNSYHKEYEIMNKLGKFSEDYGVCCLLVHHDRKVKNGVDVLGGVSGTRAMTGAAQTIWVLSRDYESDQGELFCTGKHIAERRIDLRFDKDTLRWEIR